MCYFSVLFYIKIKIVIVCCSVAVDCPGELHFRECIPCCPTQCNIERMCIDSKLQCLDGCYCPEGG